MQTIQFKVDNNYIETILSLLNSLNNIKLNIIEDLLIINDNRKQEKDNHNDLNTLNRLFEQSNNKIIVTKENAIDTNEMIDDISRY